MSYNENRIDIRPTTSVYSTFERLSYEPWYAIAEFVDNSTQSFYDHLDELNNLTLNIKYIQSDDDKADFLVIKDDAYGMNREDFTRAVSLDKKPPNTSGRNEFGMGLKTAACWFSKRWMVQSTRLGSREKYIVVIDVEKLKHENVEFVEIKVEECDPNEHGTKIILNDLNRKIKGKGQTQNKIRKMLSGIYRQDLRSGKIKIFYDDELLSYEQPNILTDDNPDGSKTEWRRDIDFSIEHENQQLGVTGFVAIKADAKRQTSGFALFRRGRAIIGGKDSNYFPDFLGEKGQQKSIHIFGELNLDNFPVTQAKDNFDWHNDGLEEKFTASLESQISELLKKASNYRVKGRKNTLELKREFENDFNTGEDIHIEVTPKYETQITSIDEIQLVDDTEDKTVSDVDLNGPQEFDLKITYIGTSYEVTLRLESCIVDAPWLTAEHLGGQYRITLNTRHRFFRPFISQPDFIKTLGEFSVALVIAEIEATKIQQSGRGINPDTIRIKLGEILQKIGGNTNG